MSNRPIPPETPLVEDPALLALAREAANEVEAGMLVGLGSGSTAEALVRELGRRHAAGLRFTGVPTSHRTASLAASLGIPLRTLDDVLATGDQIVVGLDGADEIDLQLGATKGRGGALLFEKLVAIACRRFVLIAGEAKLVSRLGSRMPLPVEVVALGWAGTAARLADQGFNPRLRTSPTGDAYRTDSNNVILDCAVGALADPDGSARALKATTGVVEHGLFIGIARAAYVVDSTQVVRQLRATGSTATD